MQEFIQKLTWVDCLVFIGLLRGCYVGYRSGFFPELLRIAAYLVTVVVTFRLQPEFAEMLVLRTFLNEATAGALSLAALLGGVFLVMKLLISLILRLLKVGEGGFVYRLLGALVGSCRWLILLSLLFMLIDRLPLGPLQADIHQHSFTGPWLSQVAPTLFDFLSRLSPQFSPGGGPL